MFTSCSYFSNLQSKQQVLANAKIIHNEVNQLNFPQIAARIESAGGQYRIYDEVRRKWLILTPEEWVRQHLIHFLRDHLGYPASLMGVEKSLKYNGMSRRSDLVVYGKDTRPLLLAECKAPDIKIDAGVFDQAARYNLQYQVPYLLVTNGMDHYFCMMDFATATWKFQEKIPRFLEIAAG
jgi:hypothetical protein